MEADWEVELDLNSQVIDAQWVEFVDLRKSPQRAYSLPEVAELPPLAESLIRLNAPPSPVWTTKSDVWHVDTSDSQAFDPYELDAIVGSSAHAMAAYVDLLPVEDNLWPTPKLTINWCKGICERLHLTPMMSCRADLILRRAHFSREDRTGLGVTAYLTSCGPTPSDAASVLASALRLFVDCVMVLRLDASTRDEV